MRSTVSAARLGVFPKGVGHFRKAGRPTQRPGQMVQSHESAFELPGAAGRVVRKPVHHAGPQGQGASLNAPPQVIAPARRGQRLHADHQSLRQPADQPAGQMGQLGRTGPGRADQLTLSRQAAIEQLNKRLDRPRRQVLQIFNDDQVGLTGGGDVFMNLGG